MHLMEAQARAALRRGVELYRQRYERKPNVTGPDGVTQRRHALAPSPEVPLKQQLLRVQGSPWAEETELPQQARVPFQNKARILSATSSRGGLLWPISRPCISRRS